MGDAGVIGPPPTTGVENMRTVSPVPAVALPTAALREPEVMAAVIKLDTAVAASWVVSPAQEQTEDEDQRGNAAEGMTHRVSQGMTSQQWSALRKNRQRTIRISEEEQCRG